MSRANQVSTNKQFGATPAIHVESCESGDTTSHLVCQGSVADRPAQFFVAANGNIETVSMGQSKYVCGMTRGAKFKCSQFGSAEGFSLRYPSHWGVRFSVLKSEAAIRATERLDRLLKQMLEMIEREGEKTSE